MNSSSRVYMRLVNFFTKKKGVKMTSLLLLLLERVCSCWMYALTTTTHPPRCTVESVCVHIQRVGTHSVALLACLLMEVNNTTLLVQQERGAESGEKEKHAACAMFKCSSLDPPPSLHFLLLLLLCHNVGPTTTH